MRSRRLTRCFLAALTLSSLLLFSGCGGGGGEAEVDSEGNATGAIPVGAIFDLTGVTSDVGTTYSEGIRGHVDWLNANGGINGREIKLLYEDYGYKVDRAEQLYSQYVDEGAVAFLGWGTGDTEALRGRISEDHIPFMSASLSHVLGDASESPYNFLSGTSYSHQLAILLDYLKAQDPTVSKVALMHHPSPFGLSPYQQGGKDYAAQLGIELEAHEMPRGATDFTPQLTRISDSGARHVVFQTTSAPVATALKNARDLGLDFDFACLNWCSNEVLTSLAGDAAEGVLGSLIFAGQMDGVDVSTAADWLASQGESIEEKGFLFVQGWHTMGMMAEGIRRAASSGTGEVTGDAIKTALESLDGYSTGGSTAPVTYTGADHRGIKGMRIFMVSDRTWTPVTDLRMVEDLTIPM